ncbi:DUF1028 domain-containing protein [Arthrobacter sp. H14]|uniref:DUF1028 domain-containing protein n=1 Tax=Arthrobacter sp. H14 TaxID=1312959 RepID=UPI0004B4548D|nr:DUF1028 domain-containing protein [Arthrobacter sp. H14]
MTFSLVAMSRNGRYQAAATASCSLAVGNAVPAVAPGVGAVVTQAYTNKSFRHLALDRARKGVPPARILKELSGLDEGFAKRQVALITSAGTTAVHNGVDCSPWAGSLEGNHFVVLGNLLAGPAVVENMAEKLREPAQESGSVAGFARQLMSALLAGQKAGGDMRGQQSAALTIADNDAPDTSPPELLIDLRVDDAREPLVELENLLELWLVDHQSEPAETQVSSARRF